MAGPSPATGALKLAVAAALLLGLVVSDDPIFRVLLVPAALLLIGAGVRDLLLRPTLRATSAELTVVSGLNRITVPWSEVAQLRVVTDRRVPLLEIDLGETLVVLSRTRLGVPPDQVLDELEALRRP